MNFVFNIFQVFLEELSATLFIHCNWYMLRKIKYLLFLLNFLNFF